MNITFVISALGSGGSERVLTLLANHWAARQDRVTVITLAPAGEDFFRLDGRIVRVGLDAMRDSSGIVDGLLNNVRRLTALRSAVKATAPDVVISFLDRTNILTLAATAGTALPVVCEEHCDPNTRPLPVAWSVTRQLLYPMADAIVALSPEAMAFFAPGIRRSGAIIPNPVLPAPPRRPRAADAAPTLVSVGRLNQVKQFDVMLRVFARLAPRHPGWRLQIWGDGPERERLQALIDSLGIGAQASLRGATSDVFAALESADLFVMTSRTEGFPMALAEAMAFGVPAVSFDCPSGPRQLIRSDVNGVLVADGDEVALEGAIERLMADRGERERLGSNARRVTNDFSMERIAALWDELLLRVARVEPAADALEGTAA